MKEYLQSQDDVISSLKTTRDGLTAEEAGKRLSEYGPNKLEEKKKDSILKKFLEELSDPMLIILMIAAVLSVITSAAAGPRRPLRPFSQCRRPDRRSGGAER